METETTEIVRPLDFHLIEIHEGQLAIYWVFTQMVAHLTHVSVGYYYHRWWPEQRQSHNTRQPRGGRRSSRVPWPA